MATPRAVPKRSGSSSAKWFFTGVLPIHETIPLQILEPFTKLCDVGHTFSAHVQNAQIRCTYWRAHSAAPPRCVMFLTEAQSPDQIWDRPSERCSLSHGPLDDRFHET